MLWRGELPGVDRKSRQASRSRHLRCADLPSVGKWRGQEPEEAGKLPICCLSQCLFPPLWENKA
jgi:hypothetical protein